jgi:hypothetical protein
VYPFGYIFGRYGNEDEKNKQKKKIASASFRIFRWIHIYLFTKLVLFFFFFPPFSFSRLASFNISEITFRPAVNSRFKSASKLCVCLHALSRLVVVASAKRKLGHFESRARRRIVKVCFKPLPEMPCHSTTALRWTRSVDS